MLTNVQFIQNKNSSVNIDSDIGIKLINFGVGTMRKNRDITKSFRCTKQHIIQNEQYLAPNIRRQNDYDGKSADLWYVLLICVQFVSILMCLILFKFRIITSLFHHFHSNMKTKI